MRSHDHEQAEADWRSSARRAKAIWDRYIGGTLEELARELNHVGGLSTAASTLGQNLRPRGRKPRQSAVHLTAFAKVLAVKLAEHRRDLTAAQLEQRFKAHIVTGAQSPLQEVPPVAARVVKTGALTSALWSFDLWTPGQSGEAILREFGNALGEEVARTVRDLSRDAIDAIGRGDFARQSMVADQAIGLGAAAPETPLIGEGLYLKGEALRLMADFEPDRAEARRLRLEAEQFYGRAEEALKGDPRPIRGRGRTIEVLGDLDMAWDAFEQSLAAVQVRGINQTEADHLSLAHERVRTLRHKISCLAAMHAESPLATLAAQNRAEEIRRLIMDSEPQHEEALRLFQRHGDWWRIEWFMAQVLHAKGWAAIREDGRAAKRLEWSLRQRLEMMPDEGLLTAVELGNLHWWMSVARDVRPAFELDQQRALAALTDSLSRGADRQTIKSAGRDFLRAGGAPWSRS